MEFLSFLRLYIRELEFDPGMPVEVSLLLTLAPLLFNLAEYGTDLYQLVKKKTAVETLAVMQLPLAFAVWGTLFLTCETGIPTGVGLAAFQSALCRRGTARGLLLLCLAGMFLTAQARALWNRRKLSLVAGTLLAVLVALPCLYLLVTGQLLIFYDFPDIILISYLYAVLFLLCRVLLLALGTFVRLCTAKMRKPLWYPARKPLLLFLRYYLLRQNAVLRGTLALWLPGLSLLALRWHSGTVHLLDSAALKEFRKCSVMSLFLGTGAILLSLLPTLLSLRHLGRQGNLKARLGLFCQEYFEEDSHGSYTVTLHFLVDEGSPAAIRSWSELCGCSDGWVSSKKGWVGILRFEDGKTWEIPKEYPQAKSLMDLARRRLGKDLYPEQTSKKTRGLSSAGAGTVGQTGFFIPRRLGIVEGVCVSVLADIILIFALDIL